jgi:plasmid stability protein
MHAISIRFRDEGIYARLRSEAAATGQSVSACAEQLISEGLRRQDHPLIVFRDGPTGRRATLVTGPDVWEVVGYLSDGDVPADERVAWAAEMLRLPISHIDAAMRYYAAFTEEIDARIAANLEAADRELRLWEKQQALFGR